MSNSPQDTFPTTLLDLHLGHLSDQEREAYLTRIAGDAKLTEQHAALTAAFEALRGYGDVRAPSNLADRICARVARSGLPPRIARPVDGPRAGEWSEGVILRLGNLREIIAVAATIVLLIGIGVPGLLSMRERGQRMGCSNNLARLGQGLQQYAAAYAGSLPFVGWTPRFSWQPSQDPNVQIVPNRRHLSPLLQGAFVLDPRLFVCPGRGDAPMSLDQMRTRSDFPESRNLSYALYNMAGVRPSVHDEPTLPIVADDNPLFEDGVPLLDRLGLADPTSRNSRNHNGDGQNVLRFDGRLKWTTTPNTGIHGDNIWTLQGVRHYTGREGPRTPQDAHLLK